MASYQTLKARKDKLDVQLILANHARDVLEYTEFVETEIKKKLGFDAALSFPVLSRPVLPVFLMLISIQPARSC
jgi:hypothetical protein